jgi:hypothetical protein
VILLVGGTHCLKPEASWWRPGSDFRAMLAKHNLDVLGGNDPFRWSGVLGGVPTITPADQLDHLADQPALAEWASWGRALKWYYDTQCIFPADPLDIICHSHGLQLVVYACIYGLRVRRLVDICGPIRRDMLRQRRAARPWIQSWLHIWSAIDSTQIEGELTDGDLLQVREAPEADVNREIDENGHSRMLYVDPSLFERSGCIAWLKGDPWP